MERCSVKYAQLNGMLVWQSQLIKIIGCNISRNEEDGLWVYYSTSTLIHNCCFYHNGWNAIDIVNSSMCTINDCLLAWHRDYALGLYNTDCVAITSNIFQESGNMDIYFYEGSHTIVKYNDFLSHPKKRGHCLIWNCTDNVWESNYWGYWIGNLVNRILPDRLHIPKAIYCTKVEGEQIKIYLSFDKKPLDQPINCNINAHLLDRG